MLNHIASYWIIWGIMRWLVNLRKFMRTQSFRWGSLMYQVAFSMPFILNNSIEFRVPHSASKLEAATVGCFKKAVGRMEQTRHALPDKPPSKRSPSAESLVRTGWHLTTVAMLALEIGINVKNTGRYWHLVAKSEFAKNLDKINLRIHVWWIDELLMNSQVLRTVLPLGFCRFPGHRPSIIRVVQVRPGTKEELHLFTIWRCPPGPNGLQTPQDMHFAYV